MSNRRQRAAALRALAIDAVEQAQSGHPGMPLGMADIAEVLWHDFLQHHPGEPNWPNRDRFVLSNGHGSMLQYALLHLTGYDLSIDDLRQFRQLHAKTPGHPEYGLTPGIETTTGPLGQGLANAVGMALAERVLGQTYNRPGFDIINHYSYVFLGDGCLMEGVSHEACSLAGTWQLGKLIAFWDDNQISIDGETAGWLTDNTPQRFEAYGWQVVRDVDGHDPEAITQAILQARAAKQQPTLICCRTQIGYGSPNKAGTAATHGAPLGAEEAVATKQALAWEAAPFEIPQALAKDWDARTKGAAMLDAWQSQWQAYQEAHPDLALALQARWQGELPKVWHETMHALIEQAQALPQTKATRRASGDALEALAPVLPALIGGSADLSGSNCTLWPQAKPYTASTGTGNYLHYGVREFAMAAIMNGLALYGGFIPFGGTFLTFLDYARNAVRMAALMRLRAIFVFTHDSIGLGEDGPTHQPIEHLSMLRVTPNVTLWRPCDEVETLVAWQQAVQSETSPTCLVLSRQALPGQARTAKQMAMIQRGGYVLQDCDGLPSIILLATGSEVSLAMQAASQLMAKRTCGARSLYAFYNGV